MTSSPNTVAGHTPLPWAAHPVDDFGDIGIHRHGEQLVVCSVIRNGWMSAEEVAANARLIIESVNNHDRLTAEVEKLRVALDEIFATAFDGYSAANGYQQALKVVASTARTALEGL